MNPWQCRVRRWLGGAVALLAAAILPACDGGTDPEPAIVDIEINGAPTSAIAVGDTARLTSIVANAEGEIVADAAVNWSSTNPAVASVPAPGVVVGQGDGTARIVASIGDVADTVDITVTAIIGGCPAGGLTFPVGAIRQLTTATDPIACPIGGASGAEYVLVAFNGAESGSLNLGVQVSGLAQNRLSERGLYGSRSNTPVSLAPAGPTRDLAFEERIRSWEYRNFARYAPAARAMRDRAGRGGPSFSRSAAVPVVGDILQLNVNLEPCTPQTFTKGRVAAVTDRAIIVSDTANPDGGFTDAEYREIGLAFDTLVFPVDTANFGAPTDIDQNQRVIIFYTKAVNELTEPNSDSYVGGFFYSRDLFPRTTSQEGLQGCPGSNLGEMFYMLVADPLGQVNGNVRTKEFVRRETVATIAHEFQHLINSSRRIYINNVFVSEQTWLNEGLSHIAEELVFFRASGLQPRQNLTIQHFPSGSRQRAMLIEFNRGNLGRFWDYLESPNENSPYASNDNIGTRGASWAFLRYMADQLGRPETELWKALANGANAGLANLRAVTAREPIPMIRDWTVAVFADDVVSGATARYSQPSYDFRTPANKIYNLFQSPPTLQVVQLTNGSTSRSIVAGGGSFFSIPVPTGGRADLRLNAGGAPVPGSFSAFLVRVR